MIISNSSGYSIMNNEQKLYPETIDILKALNDRSLSGNEAKERVSEFLCDLKEEWSEVFAGIVNKDLKLDLGVKSINKVFPGLIPLTEDGDLTIPIMLLKTYNKKKTTLPLLAAPKLDGVRGRFFNGKIYSRSRKRIIGLDHIEEELSKLGNDFDGEIIVPKAIFDDSSGLIRNKKPVPEAEIHIFDIPDPNFDKKTRLHLMNDGRFHETASCIKIIKHKWIDYERELEQYYQSQLKLGYEGIVLYNPNSLYQDKRSYDWMRLVPLNNVDVECTGIFEGSGKYEFNAGGIYVDFNGVEVKVGTGFSDGDRKKMWEDQNHYIGLIAEIEFKEVTKKGSMRQPRFKCWRLEKSRPNIDYASKSDT